MSMFPASCGEAFGGMIRFFYCDEVAIAKAVSDMALLSNELILMPVALLLIAGWLRKRRMARAWRLNEERLERQGGGPV